MKTFLSLLLSFKNFIKNLLSGRDEISSNRTIGVFVTITMIGMMIFGLYSPNTNPVIFKIVIDNLLYLIIATLFLKSGDKIISFFGNKTKNPSDSE